MFDKYSTVKACSYEERSVSYIVLKTAKKSILKLSKKTMIMYDILRFYFQKLTPLLQ